MADQKLMIAARNKKGQIGYLSEGLSLPEFAELFKSKGDLRILVDYSPVIQELHRLHKVASSEDILKKYNALFNFWQDAKSYTKEAVKISKAEELSVQANSLINDLHIELQKSEKILSSKWGSRLSEWDDVVNNIKRDSNIYIDTLLCFIHSKASLDIDSFKSDVTLLGYGHFLQEFVNRIYRRLLNDGRPQDPFLKFIAFEQPENLQDYLDLEHRKEDSDQYLLRVLKSKTFHNGHDEHDGYYREIHIRYPSYPNEFVAIVEVFRDLLHKISSVNAFLAKLKEGGYQWEDGTNFVDELRENIHLLR